MAKQKGPVRSLAIRLDLVVATVTDLTGYRVWGPLGRRLRAWRSNSGCRGTNHDLVSESTGLEQKGRNSTRPNLPSCFPRPLTLFPLSSGKLWHQLGAANALGGSSCCWSPSPSGPLGIGLLFSQRGIFLLLTLCLLPTAFSLETAPLSHDSLCAQAWKCRWKLCHEGWTCSPTGKSLQLVFVHCPDQGRLGTLSSEPHGAPLPSPPSF